MNIRARGNDVGVGQIKRVFHDGAVKATKADVRDSEKDAYWYGETGKQKNKGLWYVYISK